MREAQAWYPGPSRPSPIEVLAEAAGAIHGPSALEDKLAWLVEAVRTLTDAKLAAYVGAGRAGEVATSAAGAASYDVDTFARPALERLVPVGRGPSVALAGGLPGLDLTRNRRWQVFLERVGLPSTAASLCVLVVSEDGPAYGIVVACHPDPDHFGGEDEMAVATLAAHLGVALDNELRLARLTELHDARRAIVHQLQEAVRPPMPVVPATELGIHYLPADPSAPTGGDLHDW